MLDPRITPADQNSLPLNIRRLILIGVGLPALIAAVNYALMSEFYSYTGVRPPTTALHFVWFIVQVGLVGLVVGHGISQAWLRWAIFIWIMLLINLLTFAIVPVAGLWRAEAAIPAAALFAGQIGLCVTWAFFGDGRWPIRVGLMALVAAGLYYFWALMSRGAYGRNLWDEMLLWQVAALVVLSALLRLKGFRLASKVLPEFVGSGRRKLAPTQFGIRDVLVWTTVLAVFLGIARALDLLNWQAAQDLMRTGAYWKLTVTTASAMAILVAMWMALGDGDYRVRYPAGMCLIVLVGMMLSSWSSFRAWRLKALAARPPFPGFDSDLMRLYEIGPWWLGWVFLTAGLLAAMLIILRARGYRLVRQSQP